MYGATSTLRPFTNPLVPFNRLGVTSNGASATNMNFAESMMLPPNITFTRSSNAWYWDATGTLQMAGVNVARMNDYDPITKQFKGFLHEITRTNANTNSSYTGAVNGPLNAAGTMGTNWGYTQGSGITMEVMGNGTEFGMRYVDLKVSGTATGGSGASVRTSGLSATTNQNRAQYLYARTIAGSVSGITSINFVNIYGGGAAAGRGGDLKSQLSATLTKLEQNFTTPSADVTSVTSGLEFVYLNGAVINYTIRLYHMQIEAGQPFASSPIVTTGTASTRNGDATSITNLATIGYNPNGSTVFQEFETYASLNMGTFFEFQNNSSNYIMVRRGAADSSVAGPIIQLNGVNVTGGSINFLNMDSGSIYRIALGFGGSAVTYAVNGIVQSGNNPTLPTVLSLRLGGGLCGWLKQFTYWPYRMANADMRRMSEAYVDVDFTQRQIPSWMVFTRASAGWHWDSNGDLTRVESGVPRFDCEQTTGAVKGYLSEKQTTNLIPNSAYVSAALGGVSSGGSVGTTWSYWQGSGVTMSVVGIGQEYGMNYVDILYSGVSGGSNGCAVRANNLPCTTSQDRAHYCYARYLSGEITGTNAPNTINMLCEFNGGASTMRGTDSRLALAGGGLVRLDHTFTTPSTGVTSANIGFEVTYGGSKTMNLTLRFYHCQAEASGISTSPVVTTGSAATRVGDTLSVQDLSRIKFSKNRGTFMIEGNIRGSGVVIGGDKGTDAYTTGIDVTTRFHAGWTMAGRGYYVLLQSGNPVNVADSVSVGADSLQKYAWTHSIVETGGDYLMYGRGQTLSSKGSGDSRTMDITAVRIGMRNLNNVQDHINTTVKRFVYIQRCLPAAEIATWIP